MLKRKQKQPNFSLVVGHSFQMNSTQAIVPPSPPPAYAQAEMRKLQAKALSYDEFTKMQKIVKTLSEDRKIKRLEHEEKEEELKKVFSSLLLEQFPKMRSSYLKIKEGKTPGIKVYAYKLAKTRPEVYLIINDADKQFQIADQKMVDIYHDGTFIKPDWNLLFT